MIKEFKELLQKLTNIEAYTALSAKEVLTLTEAAAFTGYARNTLYSMTSNQQIPHYKRGNMVYFKKDELVAWMTAEPVPTLADYEAFAASYCFKQQNPVERYINRK